MFNINPLSLPSVSLEERSQLPKTPCIYFVIDSEGMIQYIGRSINPNKRWTKHQHYYHLEAMGGIKIAYLTIDTPEMLPSIERALIAWFKPPLNNAKIKGKGLIVRRTIVKEVSGLGQRIKQAREADKRSLEVICAEAGISRVYWYDIEKESVRDSLPEETLRKIEKVLGVDLGVNFDV